MSNVMKLPVAARVRFAEIEDSSDQAAQSYQATSQRISELTKALNINPTGDHAEGYEFEISRLQGVQVQQRETMMNAANVARLVKEWLARQPDEREFEDAPMSPPKLRKGETPLQGVQRLRGEIAKLGIERQRVAAAAMPIAELKERANEFVLDLTERGRPEINTDASVLTVGHDSKGFGPSRSIILAFAAWLDPEKFTARLHQEIDELAKTCELRMSAREKSEKLSEIAADIRKLATEEEAVIREAASQGQQIARRFDVDPQVVLGVRRKRHENTKPKHRVLIHSAAAPT